MSAIDDLARLRDLLDKGEKAVELGKQVAKGVERIAHRVADTVIATDAPSTERTWQDERADTLAFLKTLVGRDMPLRMSEVLERLERGDHEGSDQRPG